MPLDKTYGPLIPPQSRTPGGRGFQPWEQSNAPKSLTRLDDDADAGALKRFMRDVTRDWKVGRVLFHDITILWVVAEDGAIWMAVEELVIDGVPVGVPRHQTMRLPAGANKLGHPSLVACSNARIGGEIQFDKTLPSPAWVIDNRSGRYSFHPSRTANHLHNVRNRFSAVGIECVARFIS